MSVECDGHADLAGLASEVRVLVLRALDRLGPVLDRANATPAPGEPSGARPCEVCPVCALIALWRGERSELGARAAEHVAGLVAVLRTALDEGAGAPGSVDETACAAQARPVQRISVARG